MHLKRKLTYAHVLSLKTVSNVLDVMQKLMMSNRMSMILMYKNQNKTTLDFWKSIKVNIKREKQEKKYLYKVFLNCYEMSHGF